MSKKFYHRNRYYDPETSSSLGCRHWGKWTILLIALIFFLSTMTFVLHRIQNDGSGSATDSDGEQTIIRILMRAFGQSPTNASNTDANAESMNKIVLINVAGENDTEHLLSTIIRSEDGKSLNIGDERQARAAALSLNANATTTTTNQPATKLSYYEEQRPVVVHAESKMPPPPSSPASSMTYAGDPYADDNPYYDDSVGGGYDSGGYYQQRTGEQRQSQLPQSRPPPYYDDVYDDELRAAEPQSDPSSSPSSSEESRAAQYPLYDSYYRQQWNYATPSPPQSGSNLANIDGMRKLQTPVNLPDRSRNPYPAYEDELLQDYGFPVEETQQQQQMPQYRRPTADANEQGQMPSRQQQQPQQMKQQPNQYQQQQQQRLPSKSSSPSLPVASSTNVVTATATATPPATSNEQNNLISVVKSLKTMWDIYQAFSAAWNVIAEHRLKQEETAKQKYREQLEKRKQQIRINSRKPPKFETNNSTRPATSTSTATATVTKSTTTTTEMPPAKVEPRRRVTKGPKNAHRDDKETPREKRQSTDVGEGRYIKGDPLKGYYDFVITEGSYKFWAVFQLGTALLIIYSTFASIYYSKVNPLVSDYDYTDYLGGARSLTGGDDDFVDDVEADVNEDGSVSPTTKTQRSWFDWVPRTGHSLKFILDAIDKLPSDHDEENKGSLEGDGVRRADETDQQDSYYAEAEGSAESESEGGVATLESEYADDAMDAKPDAIKDAA